MQGNRVNAGKSLVAGASGAVVFTPCIGSWNWRGCGRTGKGGCHRSAVSGDGAPVKIHHRGAEAQRRQDSGARGKKHVPGLRSGQALRRHDDIVATGGSLSGAAGITACCIEEIPHDIGRPGRLFCRHCERSEAIQTHDASLDCFASLAMTALKRNPPYEKRVWLRPAAALCLCGESFLRARRSAEAWERSPCQAVLGATSPVLPQSTVPPLATP